MRDLTYWYQSGILFMIEDLSLLQRNILGLVAGTKKRGLLFHNYEIAHQFLASIHAVKEAVKILADKHYITITKAGSPHRKLFASDKTKEIIRQAILRAKAAKKDEVPNSTGPVTVPVEKEALNSTGTPSVPVTGPFGYPLQGQLDSQCLSKEGKTSKKDAALCLGDNNSSSVLEELLTDQGPVILHDHPGDIDNIPDPTPEMLARLEVKGLI